MNSHKQKKHSALKKTVSVAVMGSVCLTAAFSVAAFTRTVTVTDGDKTVTINTMNTDTSDILVKSEVSLGDDDKIIRTDNDNEDVSISILRAFSVAEAAEEAASENSINLIVKENDTVALGEDKNESSDIEVQIENWVSIKLDLRGKALDKDVPAGTVADALAYLNIELSKDDKLNVKADQELKDGMELKITRTEYKNVTKTEKIDYKTIEKDTDELYVGESKVASEGAEGERKITIKETYVNGEKTAEEVTGNEVTKEAEDRVVLNGTAEKVSRIDTASGAITVNESANTITDKYGNTLNYTRVITGSSTAYTADPGAICSTGRLARYGVVAVDPDIIPYGSILYIVSDDGIVYGYAVAGDTGGFIYNGTGTIVDLYYPDLQDCYNYGRRGVQVYVLSGVSEDATYNN